jgi:hypothetical protein
MKHIVIEAGQVFQWDGGQREWLPVSVAKAMRSSWVWPDRATAKKCGFVPPAGPPADAGHRWADTVVVREPGGWISVLDRLPAETMDCLVTDGGAVVCRVWSARSQKWIDTESCAYPAVEPDRITHWHSIPAPPHRSAK